CGTAGRRPKPLPLYLHHRLDLASQRHVLGRHGVLAPCVQGHPDPVVMVHQVRMVVRLLSLLGQPVDEVDGLHERTKREVLDELPVAQSPPGELVQRPPDLFVRQAAQLTPSSSREVSAFSTMSRPSDSRPSSIDRGGSNRTTLSYVPALRTITPSR